MVYFVCSTHRLRPPTRRTLFCSRSVWVPPDSREYFFRVDGSRHGRALRNVPELAHPKHPFKPGVDRLYSRTHYLLQRPYCAPPHSSIPFPLLSSSSPQWNGIAYLYGIFCAPNCGLQLTHCPGKLTVTNRDLLFHSSTRLTSVCRCLHRGSPTAVGFPKST